MLRMRHSPRSSPIRSAPSSAFRFNPISTGESARPGGGTQFYLNVQPVIPLSLNADWNVVSRTIVPIVSQNEIFSGSGNQFGLSDTLQNGTAANAFAPIVAEFAVKLGPPEYFCLMLLAFTTVSAV